MRTTVPYEGVWPLKSNPHRRQPAPRTSFRATRTACPQRPVGAAPLARRARPAAASRCSRRAREGPHEARPRGRRAGGVASARARSGRSDLGSTVGGIRTFVADVGCHRELSAGGRKLCNRHVLVVTMYSERFECRVRARGDHVHAGRRPQGWLRGASTAARRTVRVPRSCPGTAHRS